MIQLPKKIKTISEEGDRAIFEISPLYPGYGVTVGNSLRRVLLSSLEGAAITSIKIKGANHEFSTIPGILEDVIEIIMNLKKIRLKIHSDEPVLLSIKVKGEKKVTARDIEINSNVEIVNPDQPIATITDKKTEFEAELSADRGIGYVPVDQRQKEKLSVGMINIDAIYSPVTFVSFKVENIRVGQRTDYNKLVIEVETDGTMLPLETLKKASGILIDQFRVISGEEVEGVLEETGGKMNNIEAEEEEVTVKKSSKSKKDK